MEDEITITRDWKSNMREDKIERIVKSGIGVLASLFLLFLLGNRLGYSYRFPREYYEIATLTKVPVYQQLLFLLFTTLVLLGVAYCYSRIPKKERFNQLLLIIMTILLAITSILWVFDGTVFQPGGDPQYICESAKNILNGQYDSLMKGGYLERYPYQKGITFLIECIFFIFKNNGYTVLYLLNALSIPAIYVTGYQIQKRCTGEFGVFLYLVLLPLCFPLIFYSCFIYGECMSILFTLLTILSVLNWREHWSFRFVGGISAFLALVFRTNSVIVFIAIFLLASIESIKKRTWKLLFFSLYLFVIAFAGKMCLELQYEIRTGIEAEDGMPVEGWLLMGIQEGVRGNGWYNDVSVEVYDKNACDSKAAAEEFRMLLSERLLEMKESPRYTFEFFKKKVLSQWNEATLESLLVINSSADTNTFTKPKQKLLFYEWYSPFINFMENYQLVIYIGALSFALFMLKKREQKNLFIYIPILTFIGGFIFQTIWEAKSRYILYYYVLLILCSTAGIEEIVQWGKTIIKRRRKEDVTEVAE